MIVSDRIFPEYLHRCGTDERLWPLALAINHVSRHLTPIRRDRAPGMIRDAFSADLVPLMSSGTLWFLEFFDEFRAAVDLERRRREATTKEYRIATWAAEIQNDFYTATRYVHRRPRARFTRELAVDHAKTKQPAVDLHGASEKCVHLPVSLWNEQPCSRSWPTFVQRPFGYDKKPWVDTKAMPFERCFLGFGAWLTSVSSLGQKMSSFGGFYVDGVNVSALLKSAEGEVYVLPVQWALRSLHGDDELLGLGYTPDALGIIRGSFGSPFLSHVLRRCVEAATTHELPVVCEKSGASVHGLGERKRALPEPGYVVPQQPLTVGSGEPCGEHRSPHYRFDVRGHWAHRVRRIMGALTEKERERWLRRETDTCRYRFIEHPVSKPDAAYLESIGRKPPGNGQYLRVTEFWVRGHIRGPEEETYVPSTKSMGANRAAAQEMI